MDPFSSTVMLPHAISANLDKRQMGERSETFAFWKTALALLAVFPATGGAPKTYKLRGSPPQGVNRVMLTRRPLWTGTEVET